MEEHIRANAELVIQQLRPLSNINFGYTRDSVEWLEGYIERLRDSGEFNDAEAKNNLTSVLGSFLGECPVAQSQLLQPDRLAPAGQYGPN